MYMKTKSPFGEVEISCCNELLSITAECDLGAYWAQGYGSAHLRLWQMDLTRRVAGGELCEILGTGARRTDVFQRRLGLRELAGREVLRAQQVYEATGEEELQAQQVRAYVEGVNAALAKMRWRPFECVLLHYRPRPFTVEDVYAIAHLKYFINSAWQYEMFHTSLLKRLNAGQANQLMRTFTEEGGKRSPLSYTSPDERSLAAEQALCDGLEGLRLLGLSSPDTGSNVFAVSGRRSANGVAMLASDPHMGHVNPNYCLLCHLRSGEGLNVMGANFPGAPGIVVGRNAHAAWGMVGLMADNQDLSFAEVDWQKERVKVHGHWVPLVKTEHHIKIKGQDDATLNTYAFDQGRLIQTGDSHALFLRWPALDASLGDIVMHKTARCTNWDEFRMSLAEVYNAPMMAGYADVHGDIGLQTVGLFPERDTGDGREHLGSLIQKADVPASGWEGYVAFEELPTQYNPPEGYVVYANQYSQNLFDGRPLLSNRWHSPARALRIQELILQKEKLSAEDMMAIQDDKTDYFARQALPFLLSCLKEGTPLSEWEGDTAEIQKSLMFERWMYLLGREITAGPLSAKVFALYTDFWPSYRWCVMDIVQHHLGDWLGEENRKVYEADPQQWRRQLVQKAYQQAVAGEFELPQMEFQHSIKKPALLQWLLTGRAPYVGGNRETVHATRQNVDFLTSSQTQGKSQPQKPFTFGPAFKLVSELGEGRNVHYMINTPAKARPFFFSLKPNLRRWQRGERFEEGVTGVRLGVASAH